jgi:hypothetical protein
MIMFMLSWGAFTLEGSDKRVMLVMRTFDFPTKREAALNKAFSCQAEVPY